MAPPTNLDPRQLHELLEYCRQFGQEMIAKYGEFHPFGAHLKPSGEVVADGAFNGEEFPSGQSLYSVLLEAFQREAAQGNVSAVALAANVDIPATYESPFPDGIRVLIEAPGYSRFFYFPYRRLAGGLLARLRGSSQKTEFAEVITVDVPASIFTRPVGG